MSYQKDLTGTKLGLLTLVDRKRENNRTYYLCECQCGNKKWIRADSLSKKNPTLSCGCLAEDTQFKANDISGKRFGRLIAITATDERCRNNGSVIWKCKCDCGNISYVAQGDLQKGVVSSCGCYRKDLGKEKGRKVGEYHIKNHIIDDTNIQIISSTKPYSTNTSGHKGVLWDSARKKWKAEIRFKKKFYYLGRYDNKEDAIKVREEAEEKLHKEFIRNLKNKKDV